MDNIFFTLYQALQLLALGPCLFMLFFLCVTTRKLSQLLVPVLYFLSLACSFLLPLRDFFPPSSELHGLLLMGESLTPSLSFLLIVQFLSGRMPSLIYWGILAVPLIGGSSIVYSTIITSNGEVCIYEHLCSDVLVFKQLYTIFSGALTFLLTMFVYNRLSQVAEGTPYQLQHKKALVLALIVLNLAVLGMALAQITGHITQDRADLATTIIRIGFIYLVLTSVFRVFDRAVQIDYDKVPTLRPQGPSERDVTVVEKVRTLLTQDKIYRNMELDRKTLASQMAVSEHYLSRLINRDLGQSFTTLVNQYRVQEAKERLTKENTAITIIGFEVGFSSIPSFNRVFKQVVGVPPSEYRSVQQAVQKK